MSDELKIFHTMKVMNYTLIALVVVLIGLVVYQTVYYGSMQSHILSVTSQLANNTNKTDLLLSTLSLSPTNSSNSNPNHFGSTIANIDQPLNSTELSIINNAPQSNFITAGNMYLNGTLSDFIVSSKLNSSFFTPSPLVIGGKPSVVYIGALSCIYCGENRWAMALALSRFGNFSTLYKGYSSFGDGDLPTLYWSVYNYTTPEGMAYGNSYNSKYINFISADYESPVTQGFEIQPLSYFVSKAPNATYKTAMLFMNNTNRFQGTPFTLWGNVLMPGADGVVFGNTMPSSNSLPLTYMTHSDVLSQISSFNSQFSYAEYASADVYVAFTCPSLKNPPSICNTTVIKAIENKLGISSA